MPDLLPNLNREMTATARKHFAVIVAEKIISPVGKVD